MAQCRVTTSKEANYWFPSSTLTVSEQREDIAEYYGRSHHPRLQTHSRWLLIQVLLLRPLPVQTVTYTFQISGSRTSLLLATKSVSLKSISPDGIQGLPTAVTTLEFYSMLCGANIGADGVAVSLALASNNPYEIKYRSYFDKFFSKTTTLHSWCVHLHLCSYISHNWF